ncbi:MAG: hypothetical protein DWQ36_17345 [Acidobacteria bacterium]|nr:MAG: hypothetical protein DWQ30_05440 [Acidobacteriota bacterium]REK04611.1 MAG: hypothetical protein DWQ36_17345 [Acidobacteriota bacterium]
MPRKSILVPLLLIAAVAGYLGARAIAPGQAAAAPNLAMTPAAVAASLPEDTSDAVREKTQRYMEYESSLRLDAEQQKIKEAALTPIPAPCCSDNSALTCCCPCNLSRTIWGLTAHLIVEQGVTDPAKIQSEVESWIEEVKGPAGFSGDTCYTGGCGRAFHDNGCGGMRPSQLVL